jgi:hypothetical protein
MPYGLLLQVIVLGFAFHYLVMTSAPGRSKALVAVIVAASFVITWRLPAWHLAASMLRLGVSVYVLLYLRSQSEVRKLT